MKKNVNRRFDSVLAKKTPKTTTLRLESLESRELLSVAPGGELFAPSARAAYESNAETRDVDVLDLSAALIDAAGAANSEYLTTEGATSIVVTSAADVVDASDGVVTLREALASANAGDTITFDNSLQGKTIALNSNLGQLTVNKTLTIDASSLWNETTSAPGLTISGQNATRILRIDGGENVVAEISGITFTNGYADRSSGNSFDGHGGAIFNNGATLSLENCAISNSSAPDSGGGLYAYDGETTLVNCALTNNRALLDWDGYGGAVYVELGSLSLDNCAISGNYAERDGGGVFSFLSETTFVNCNVTNNSAGDFGGGAGVSTYDDYDGGATFVNCLIAGNSAGISGGALELYGGNATLYNCAIADNTAEYGGGVLLDANVVLDAYNTIIATNSAPERAVDVYFHSAYAVANAHNTLSSFSDWTSGANNLVYDASQPLFTNASTGDYTLASNSQALDRGDNQYVTTNVDLARSVRIAGGTVDLGAYELPQVVQLATPAPTVTAKSTTSITASWDAVPDAGGYRFIWKDQTAASYTVVLLDAATTSYRFSGLDSDASYVWKVLALGDGVFYLNSEYCATRRDKPQQTLPAPTMTVVTAPTSLTLDWNAVPNAERYTVSYKLASETDWHNVNAGTSRSYTISKLQSNTQYELRLRTIGDGLNYKSSDYSATVSAQTDPAPDPIKLDAPTGPRAAAKTATTIAAAWDAVPNAAGYRFIWKNQSDSSYTTVTLDASATSYEMTGLDASATYIWKVLATGDGLFYLNSDYCATQRVKPRQTLATPTATATAATTFVTLNWSAVPNAARYGVSYKLASASTWSDDLDAGTNLSYTIAGLAQNEQYDVRVRAIGDGVDFETSDYSTTVRVQTREPETLAVPTASATAKTETTITAAWDAVPNANGYRFIWKNQSDASYTTVLLDASATSYKMTGLDNAATYIWKVLTLGDGVSYLNSAYCATRRDKPRQSLATPTLTAAAATTSATLSWNAVANAAGYRVSYKLATASTWSSDLDAGANLSFTITGLKQNTEYDVRVEAVGDGVDYGNSDYSTTVRVKTREPETLAVPTPSVTAKTATTITAAWDAVPNASGYQFIWKNQSDASYTYVALSAAKTSYKMSGLDVDATYVWKVQALGDNVSYLKSAYCATQRDKPQQTLSTPTVTATASTTFATLAWDAVPNAEHYGISYRPSTSSTWSSDLDAGSSLGYTLTGLEKNTLYYVRVRAIGDGVDYKTSAYSTTLRVKTSEPVQLAVPTPSVTAKTETTITAAWDAVPNASGYQFIWKNQSDASYTYVTLGATATSYKMTGLDTGATYVWKVQALGDNISYLKSAYCETRRDKPRQTLATPTATAGDAAVTFLTVEWSAVPNVERYGVSYRPSTTSTWSSDVDAGTNLSYTLTGLERNTLYYVRVRAIGDGVDYKTSAYSATVRVKTKAEPVQLASPSVTVGAASNLVAITWDDVPGVTRYGVSYKPSDASTWTNVNVGKNLRYTITGLDTNVQYDVRVKAVGDETNFKSATSPIASAQTSSASVLSSSEYQGLRKLYDKLTLPESLTDVNIVVPVDWTAAAIVNAIEIARATPCDDVILLDPEKYADAVLDLSGVSITLDVDYETSGAMTILSKGMDRAQVKANASAVTFNAVAGWTQFGGFDFIDVNPDVPVYQTTSIYTIGTVPTTVVTKSVGAYTSAGTSFVDTSLDFASGNTPTVSTTPSANDYALLFVGGGQTESNFDRYYSALVDYYYELVGEFSLDPTKIYILYADGDVTGTSRNRLDEFGESATSNMTFATSIGSPVRAATGASLTATLGEIANLMAADSHLLFWTFDHGDGTPPVDKKGIVHPDAPTNRYDYLIGWNKEGISGATVRDALFQIRQGYVTCVFTQCFSGGILDDIFDPATGRLSNLYDGSAHFAGGASTNHYEYNVSGIRRKGGRVVEYLGYAQTFEEAMRQCRKSTGLDAFIYTEQNSYYSVLNKKNNVGETYAPNQGVYVNGTQHPWHAGEPFSIFTSTQPSPPTITSSSEAPNSISITWSAVQGATSYAIEYAAAGSANVVTVENISSTSYEIEGLTPATNYAFRVRANNTVYSVPRSMWTTPDAQETPSTVVTTNLDVVNIYDGLISLREALTKYSSAGDTITFAPSLQGKTIELDPERDQLYVDKSIAIDASNLYNDDAQSPGLTIGGRGKTRILCIRQTDSNYKENVQRVVVEINGITFANGFAEDQNDRQVGGAIYNENATLSLVNCVIRDNNAYAGGGVYSEYGKTTFVNCAFKNNRAKYNGGAVYVYGFGVYSTTSFVNCEISNNKAEEGWGGGACSYGGETTFTNCAIANNTAYWGGGINQGSIDQTRPSGSLSLNNCVITGNYALFYGGGVTSKSCDKTTFASCSITNNTSKGDGGGVYLDRCTTLLNNCVISGNKAADIDSEGGGVCSEYGKTTLVNCEVTKNTSAGNTSYYGGGGLAHYAGEAYYYNCTIADNSAAYGGGVRCGTSNLYAYNTIIARNSASKSGADVYLPFDLSKANAYNTLSGYASWASGANNLTYDSSKPLFTNPSANNYTLASNSQAINKGNNQNVTTYVDLAGNIRIFGGTVDLGARESRFTPSSVYPETLSAPANLREAENFGATISTVSVEWDTVSKASGYMLAWKNKTDSAFSYVMFPASTTSYELTEFDVGATYCWKVQALGDGVYYADSPYTTIRSVTPSKPETPSTVVTTENDVYDHYDGLISLREALEYANPGATITFADSLLGKTIALELGSLNPNKSIAIDASNLYDANTQIPGLTISGQNKSQILYLKGDFDVEVSGITFTNGRSYECGGAIYNVGATLSLTNCAITNNSAGEYESFDEFGCFGGGLYSYNAVTTLINCSICDNKASYGGGGASCINGEMTLVNCTVMNNAVGGRYLLDPESGPIEQVGYGGAIYNGGATLSLDNCAICDNEAWLDGGAICSFRSSETTLVNCTVTNNSAGKNGGGVFLRKTAPLDAHASVFNAYNTIIVGNSASDNAGAPDVHLDRFGDSDAPVANAYNTLSSFTEWISGANNLTYVASQPLFTNAAAGDYTLAENSQAINKGKNSYVKTSVDLAGNPRVSNGTVDLGAYEYRSSSEPIQLASPVLTVTAKTGTTMTVSWTAVANAERYSVSYKLASASTWTNVNVGTNTSYKITGLAKNTEYDVRIKAVGDGVNYKSSYSSTVRAKTTTASSALLDLGDELFDEFEELDEDDFELLASNFIA